MRFCGEIFVWNVVQALKVILDSPSTVGYKHTAKRMVKIPCLTVEICTFICTAGENHSLRCGVVLVLYKLKVLKTSFELFVWIWIFNQFKEAFCDHVKLFKSNKRDALRIEENHDYWFIFFNFLGFSSDIMIVGWFCGLICDQRSRNFYDMLSW
jgi:hypothetical protein